MRGCYPGGPPVMPDEPRVDSAVADYVAFCDPSGGSQDAMALAIAHHAEGRAVLDAVREVRPPFSPDDVVAEFATLVGQYGITAVRGDRYAGEWPRERVRAHGVTYVAAGQGEAE